MCGLSTRPGRGSGWRFSFTGSRSLRKAPRLISWRQLVCKPMAAPDHYSERHELFSESLPCDLRWMRFSVDFNENRILRFHGNGTPSNQLYLSAFPALIRVCICPVHAWTYAYILVKFKEILSGAVRHKPSGIFGGSSSPTERSINHHLLLTVAMINL